MNINDTQNKLAAVQVEWQELKKRTQGTQSFRDQKKLFTIALSNAFMISPCPENAGCEGCKCGYDGNIPDEEEGGGNPGGGGNM